MKDYDSQRIEQILKNQRAMMIWMSRSPYYEGYFSKNVEDTEELIE